MLAEQFGTLVDGLAAPLLTSLQVDKFTALRDAIEARLWRITQGDTKAKLELDRVAFYLVEMEKLLSLLDAESTKRNGRFSLFFATNKSRFTAIPVWKKSTGRHQNARYVDDDATCLKLFGEAIATLFPMQNIEENEYAQVMSDSTNKRKHDDLTMRNPPVSPIKAEAQMESNQGFVANEDTESPVHQAKRFKSASHDDNEDYEEKEADSDSDNEKEELDDVDDAFAIELDRRNFANPPDPIVCVYETPNEIARRAAQANAAAAGAGAACTWAAVEACFLAHCVGGARLNETPIPGLAAPTIFRFKSPSKWDAAAAMIRQLPDANGTVGWACYQPGHPPLFVAYVFNTASAFHLVHV